MKTRQTTGGGHTVLIACPIPDLCGQWRKVLEGTFVVEVLARGTVLTQFVMNLRPSILILDISLPELEGLQAVPVIRSLSPTTDIILLTATPDPDEALSVLKRGVKGYCDRYVSPSLMQKAVEVVQRGEIWVSRSVTSPLLEELTFLAQHQKEGARTQPAMHLTHLTAREHNVSQLVGEGFSNKQIALRLSISEKTVKTHLTTIFRKLEISDRLRLALLVSAHHSSKERAFNRADATLAKKLPTEPSLA